MRCSIISLARIFQASRRKDETMPPDLLNTIEAVSVLLSTILASIAIAISLWAQGRTRRHFEAQLELSQKVAAANVKPIVALFTMEYLDKKGIILSNAGVGTAIITNIEFYRDSQSAKNLAHLFQLPEQVIWDKHWTFLQSKFYLKAGQDLVILKLSSSNLQKQGFDEQETRKILDSWKNQLEGIEINITYEDVLGNKQEHYRRTMHS